MKSPLFLLLGCTSPGTPLPLDCGGLSPKIWGGTEGHVPRAAVIRGQLGRGSWKRQGESSMHHRAISMPPAPQIRGCQFYPGWGDSWLSFDLPRAFPRLGCKRPSLGPQGSRDTGRREGDGEAIASVFGLGFSLKELPCDRSLQEQIRVFQWLLKGIHRLFQPLSSRSPQAPSRPALSRLLSSHLSLLPPSLGPPPAPGFHLQVPLPPLLQSAAYLLRSPLFFLQPREARPVNCASNEKHISMGCFCLLPY